MKILTLAVMIIAVGMLLTACTSKAENIKENMANKDTASNTNNNADTLSASDDLSIEETSGDPDIGELDDIAVSDEIPQ